MKRTGFILLFPLLAMATHGQNASRPDSLKIALSRSNEDTNRVNLIQELSRYYNYKNPDTVLLYASQGLKLARQLNYKKGEVNMLTNIGEAFRTKGHYPKALQIKLEALHIAEQLNDPYLTSSCLNYLGALYINTGDYQKSLFNYFKAKLNEAYFKDYKKFVLAQIGLCYFNLSMMDSAYYYAKQSYELDVIDQNHWTVPYYLMASIYAKRGNYSKALDFYRAGNQVVSVGALDILNGYKGMASTYKKMNRQDSAIYYAKKVVEEERGDRRLYSAVLDASSLLADIYKSNHSFDSAFKYQEIMLAAKDSLFSQENVKLIQDLTFDEQQRREQLEEARKKGRQEYASKIKFYSLLGGLAVLSLMAFILYRNNRQKQKINILLQTKNEEIEGQRNNLELTLNELTLTQGQLVQREKMASLGELTAGIAHEIQNPLNFVNNFSEVNKDLLAEMSDEIDKGNIGEAKLIAKSVIENQDKINHHGKRADAIVKGMLQHSRKSSGQKEPTDINALCDEYLRLAYHGFRAKDISFNVRLETDFDSSIQKINVVPQECGRAILNIINNAFYAISEKNKQLQQGYEPTVSVSTRKKNDLVEIKVRDNGSGIPQKVLDKIFQPFFTTKPTGQGTGLGLSLSYDIVKAHGGELNVESKEGEESKFTILLPIN